MGLLESKGWIAQDLYNEYLQLKEEVPRLIESRDFYIRRRSEVGARDYQNDIDEKVKRLNNILDQLEDAHGVSMKSLVLLGIGVNVEL